MFVQTYTHKLTVVDYCHVNTVDAYSYYCDSGCGNDPVYLLLQSVSGQTILSPGTILPPNSPSFCKSSQTRTSLS